MTARNKILSVLLAMLLLITPLAATGIAAAEETYPHANLTALMVTDPHTRSLSEIRWLMDLQESLNLSVTWQQINADWGTKKATLFASGEIPDILINATSSADYVQFAGLFENLTPYIESHGPNIRKMFEEKPELKSLATELDGNIYGLTRYQRFWPEVTTIGFINQQWLDAVGMDIPTTWDEMYDVLCAFRDNDVNGNGDPNDEIPMDFGGLYQFSPLVWMGSLGVQLSDSGHYFVEDGEVKYLLTDERFRMYIEYLRKLYAAGLIPADAFTDNFANYWSNSRSETDFARTGVAFAWLISDFVGFNLADQYAILPQLKYSDNADYDLRYDYTYYTLNYGINRIVMSAFCKEKEAAMRLIDAFYDPYISMQVLFGGANDEDLGIRDNGDGSYYVLPTQDPAIDQGMWKWMRTFGDLGPMYISDSLNLDVSVPMGPALDERVAYQELIDKIDLKKDWFPNIFLKYTSDELNAMAFNDTNIGNITGPQWTAWVTGRGDIDAEWDAYVANVHASGMDENLRIRQQAYDAFMADFKAP